MIENPLLYGIAAFVCGGFICANLGVLLVYILQAGARREATAVHLWLKKVKEDEDGSYQRER